MELKFKQIFCITALVIVFILSIIVLYFIFSLPALDIVPISDCVKNYYYIDFNEITKGDINNISSEIKKNIIYLFTIYSSGCKKKGVSCIPFYIILVLKELKYLIDRYQILDVRNNKIKINKTLFESFLNYIRDGELYYLYNYITKKNKPFIFNMPLLVKNKNDFILGNSILGKKSLPTIFETKKTFEDYFILLETFLCNYKHNVIKKNFIKSFVQNDVDFRNQKDFKKTLVFMWKLGVFICRELKIGNNPEKEISIFNSYIQTLYDFCNSDKNKRFPYGYDWFLFASHYPTVMTYKLFIDYKTKKTISNIYISEILKYIPALNYSRNIKREKSNAVILSINFIAGNLFKNKDKIHVFNNLIKSIINSNVYKEDIVIQYQTPDDTRFVDGLYLDDGFIIHKNLVSYNYLTAYLYPSLFYKIMFDLETGNIDKVFKAIEWLIVTKRKINPIIVSRYGKFNELQNTITEFINNSKNTGNDIKIQNKNILGIKIVESSRYIIANFPTWSTQIKINSELAYGETDIYNEKILNQITMSKIMFFDNIITSNKYNEFQPNSYYPGVLSYKKFLNKPEEFKIKTGTRTYTFDKVKYTFLQLDNNRVIIYNTVTNKKLKLSYEEFIMITEYGLIVGYFNIVKFLNDDLYVVFDTDLINNNVKSEILFCDNETKVEKNVINNSSIKKVNSHVLYHNTIFNAPNINTEVSINNNDIMLVIDLDKRYNIGLNNLHGIYNYDLN